MEPGDHGVMSRAPRQEVFGTAGSLLRAFGPQPFTSAMACDAGVSREQLRSALARGLVLRQKRGQFVCSTSIQDALPTAEDRARSALASLGSAPAVITGRLGGELHGLPFVVPPSRSDEVAVSEVMVLAASDLRCGYRSVDAVVRRVDSLPEDAMQISGIPVTSLLHCAIDIVRMGTRNRLHSRARALPLPEALVVLDAATFRLGARTGGDAKELIKVLRGRFRYGTGIRAVDSAMDFLDPLAETALESWSRGYMIVYGVPAPLTQQIVTGANGIDYRSDFCWPDLKVIGEADGLGKYGSTPEEFRRAKKLELERQRALEAAGWIVVRWTWDELARDPQAVMRRIQAAIERARRRDLLLTAV